MSSKRSILVIAPGDDCWIGPKGDRIPGKVVQVCLGPCNDANEVSIQFQVAWWNGRERKCEWLEDVEVEPVSPNGPFYQVGFRES